jgi:ABC-2 type transport system ATP-binding protein
MFESDATILRPVQPSNPDGLELRDLSHRFGELVALDGAGFSVGPGEVVGLVGRNGAGKTTLMRAIMGIVRPDAGSIRWRGAEVDAALRGRFGYMPEERGLYPQMPILDQVTFFARLHGLGTVAAAAAGRRWLERLELADRADDKLIALSHGNQQRVQLTVALAHDPELIVLDEPFAGLDPAAVDSLSHVLRERAAAGVSIVFSSHQLELIERICDRIVILERGTVLADGTLEELRRRLPAQLRVRVEGGATGWAAALPGVRAVAGDGDGVLLVVDPGVDTQAILRAAQAAGPVDHFGFESAGLLDLYRQMIA